MLTTLNPEQRAVLTRVTEFADRLIPEVSERDRSGKYPAQIVDELRSLELFGLCVSGFETYALAVEELGRAWVSLLPIVNAHSSAVWTMKRHGEPEQQRRWLPELVSGDRLSCLGLTEPECGSDLLSIKATAVATATGWHLEGSKSMITHADHADVMIVLARVATGKETAVSLPASRSMGLFLLERSEWTVTKNWDKLGTRSIETCELTFDTELPQDRLIGQESGLGFAQAMDLLEVGRISVAAAAVGLGRRALAEAASSTRNRTAFGGTLAEMPSVRDRFGELSAELAAAKALTLEAARLKEQGGRCDQETSAAKVVAARAAIRCTAGAMELAGGRGYMEEFPFAQLHRDGMLFLAGEGANGVLVGLIGTRFLANDTSLDWL